MKKGLFIACAFLVGHYSFGQTFTSYTVDDGLVNDNVGCVYAHNSGDIWFGTQLGVSQFDGASTWTTYDTGTYPGMADDNILSIYIDDIDRPWIGTDFGTSFLDAGTWTTFNTDDGLGNNKVQCINQDLAGNMWFGTIVGLSKFDGVSWTNYGAADGLPFGGVNSITIHDGDLWLGTGLGGVAIYNGTDFEEITEDDGLISDKIRAIDFSVDGETWVATADGLTELSESNAFLANHTTIFTLPEPDTLNPIVDVKVDGNGVVWAGVYVDYLVTEGGVCAYNGSTWFEYDMSDGLAGPVVKALDIDENNDVWVATSTGVTKISDHSLGFTESEKTGFSLYPNPSNSIITINLPEDHIGEKLTIYNLQGEKIHTSVAEQTFTLNVADWSPGVYMVVINGIMNKLIVA